MTITVRLFAWLRERAGADRLALELPHGATVADAARALAERHASLGAELERLPVLVGGEMAGRERVLADGDEVAWLPPVAGGAGGVVEARLTREPLDAAALTRAVARDEAGAIVVFHGVVRNHEGERQVGALEYEAYEEVASARLRAIAEEAVAKWAMARVAVVHRVGRLALGEPSVLVAVSTPHRAQAFECCGWVMERVKRGVPIWKKSFGPDGETWVEGEPYAG